MKQIASRVLIVDDMPINRIILSSLLASNGVVSDQVETGQECIELCQQKDYDLILLDHRMPNMDGVDTLLKLKEIFSEREIDVPVVCHTTEEGRSNINLYKAAGFSDVLIKPIDPKQLSEILMTYLPEGKEPDENTKDEEREILLQEELDKLPTWLKSVPHIDLVKGIQNCETAEDYLDALHVFANSATAKADEIQAFFDKENWSMYTLKVHSLKSISNLIGAVRLHEHAVLLEEAGKNENIAYIKEESSSLIDEYRAFANLLKPILTDEYVANIIKGFNNKNDKADDEDSAGSSKTTILFIEGSTGIVSKGLSKNLTDADFDVIEIKDEPDQIIAHRFDSDLILYYPLGEDESHIRLIVNLLGEICQDDGKLLCITGDMKDIEIATESNGAQNIKQTYPRPVNINHFINDMRMYSHILDEYHRRKTIYIVDDDPDFLSIIDHWLSDIYDTHTFSSGRDLLDGLKTLSADLILLDYEMPEMNGFEIMKAIRKNPSTHKIPVIFLTGKNDREHVVHILESKPDGYLLKSSQKDTLIDAIMRFFTESILKGNLK